MQSINDDKVGKKVFDQTSFRGGVSSKEGHVPARIVECRVVNLNLVNYTVDVISIHDRHLYPNVQVASPYLHYSNGEGFTVMPDLGANCLVCLPSDSTAPCVLAFLMTFQKIDDASAPDAPQGTASRGGTAAKPSAASFAGGRPIPKPGDLFWRGRDGSFFCMHRGGVLQLGSTELAQRIYIPLDNRVVDISGNYAHHSTGGSIVWGVQEGNAQGTHYVETFRIFANDKYASVRVSKGKVPSPVGGGDTVYEVAIAPNGFNADSGDLVGGGAVFQFSVDNGGNVTSMGGSIKAQYKSLTLDLSEDLEVSARTVLVTGTAGAILDGGPLTQIKGAAVVLAQGNLPVARKTDKIEVGVNGAKGFLVFTGPMPPQPPPPTGYPVMITLQDMQLGSITGGSEKVKA